MTFLSAERLWLLALIPLLIGIYVLMQLRRRQYVVRFTNLALLSQVAPKRPGWRRHIAAVLFLAMLALLVVGFARPASSVKIPRDRATIIVAIDVSLSMEAKDVAPNRFEAAKAAGKKFIKELPSRFNVGVVAFAGTANVVATPSADRAAAITSLDGLVLAKRTAIGEAVFTSLQTIRSFDNSSAQDPPPAHIVLLSDGDNTIGRSVLEAVDAARTDRVPVSTIAFGTPYGTVEIEGETTPVEVNKVTLKSLADGTEGKSYEASDGNQLSEVYTNIGSSLGWRIEHRDITSRFTGFALLLALATGGVSLALFSRLP